MASINFEITSDYLDLINEAIENQNKDFLIASMEELLPQDIASLFFEVHIDKSFYLFELLSKKDKADVVRELEEDFRTDFLKNYSDDIVADLLLIIDTDDAVDILNDFSSSTSDSIIEIIKSKDNERAKDLRDLLHYDEDSAGGLMQKELIRANLNWTVNKCVDEMKYQARKVGRFYSVYVVDDNHKLLGRVSIKKMLMSEDDTLVSEIYEPEIISVNALMKSDEVAEIMKKYDLMALPVVSHQGKLLGRITIDDVVDVITEMAEQNMQAMSGMISNVDEEDSTWALTKSRLPWLMVGMLGGMLGAKFIGVYEDFISLIPAMAFFIPLITATGGNVGIQSSSIIVQSLARDSNYDDFSWNRMYKGFLVALINGLAISLLVFSINFLTAQEIKLSVVVSVALFSVVILSSLLGTITPLVLNKMEINPAVASGPFITTLNDLLGLAVYFSVAAFLYQI